MLWRRKRPFDEELRRLADADTLAFGGIGITGAMPAAAQAYFTVEEGVRQHGAALRPRLEKLLDTAKPAGRIYAAELLTHVDAEAGRAAWHRLARQDGEVTTFQGCMMGSTTLRQYAQDRLKR